MQQWGWGLRNRGRFSFRPVMGPLQARAQCQLALGSRSPLGSCPQPGAGGALALPPLEVTLVASPYSEVLCDSHGWWLGLRPLW